MARLRYDNSIGTLGASLSSGGTTITFSSAPSFPTITGSDYIPLILEPPSGSTPSVGFEIVWLTAYVAGATSGTIARGKESTAGVSHPNGVVWSHGPTALDMRETVDSTTQSGNAYTFALSDYGKQVESTSAEATQFTVPPHSSVAFPVGTILRAYQYGGGALSIVAGAGVTLRSPGGKLRVASQYSTIYIIQRAIDEWEVDGQLGANVAFVDRTSNSGANITTLALSSSIVAGDILVLGGVGVGNSGGSPSLTAPAGWTKQSEQQPGIDRLVLTVWTRVAVAGDAGSTIALSNSASNFKGAICYVFRNTAVGAFVTGSTNTPTDDNSDTYQVVFVGAAGGSAFGGTGSISPGLSAVVVGDTFGQLGGEYFIGGVSGSFTPNGGGSVGYFYLTLALN